MSRAFLFFAFWCFGACSKERLPEVQSSQVDSIAVELEKNGIWAVEFFDAKRNLHMPVANIMSCGGRPCEYKVPVIDSTNDTTFLIPLEDSLVSYDTKLREYGLELNKHMPEKGRIVVSIDIDSTGNKRDVVGVVIPILERYAIRPETVEVTSLPRDSLRVPTNKAWRLIGDSVVFRHIVDVQIQRFVRK